MERWLISYADFITLLFAFFVVMYSVSSVNEGKLRSVAEAINSAFHPNIQFSASPIKLTHEKSASQMVFLDMGLYVKVVDAVKKTRITPTPDVSNESRGVVIRLPDHMLFETGRAELLPEAVAPLDDVGRIVRTLPNAIQIEGHTDNLPIHSADFPSNWELSTARAISVMRFLNENHDVPAGRLSIAGYGEFRPLADNRTIEGRARNRRVEIILLNRRPDAIETTLADVPATPAPDAGGEHAANPR